MMYASGNRTEKFRIRLQTGYTGEVKEMAKIKRFFVWLFTPYEGVPMSPCSADYYGSFMVM